jgi:Helix-turn-helix.
MKDQYLDKYRRMGLKISYYRKLKGLTQEQLAERIDKNLAFIGAVEAPNVDRTISLDNAPPKAFTEQRYSKKARYAADGEQAAREYPISPI